MVDIIAIVIAVISLIGSVGAVGFTGYMSLYVDRAKKRDEAKYLKSNKYRDPLVLAAYDLQSRLWGFAQGNLLRYADDEDVKDNVYVYTNFLIGQYLSWTYILRRQAQFLRFVTSETDKPFKQLLDNITMEFSQDRHPDERPFMLWRGHQMAIGELMTIQGEQGQLYCLGYAAFTEKYHSEPNFKKWFQPIEKGIGLLIEANAQSNAVPTYRLRRLQHLLVDFVLLLNHQLAKSMPGAQIKMDSATGCRCQGCPSAPIA